MNHKHSKVFFPSNPLPATLVVTIPQMETENQQVGNVVQHLRAEKAALSAECGCGCSPCTAVSQVNLSPFLTLSVAASEL